MVKVVTYKVLTPDQVEQEQINFTEVLITDNKYYTSKGHPLDSNKHNLITVYRSLHQESPIDHSLGKFGLVDSDIRIDPFEIIIVVPSAVDDVLLFINKLDKHLLEFISINEVLIAVYDYLAKYFMEIYVDKFH